MKFEELIKSLRIHGDPTSSCNGCMMHKLDVRECGKALCNKAANAIEELQKMMKDGSNESKDLKKYIKSDSVLKFINGCLEHEDKITDIEKEILTSVKTYVERIPTADVVEVVRCRDCKHRRVNEHYGEKGYLRIKAMCELDTGDPFELSRNAEYDDWFCADGERKDGGQDA